MRIAVAFRDARPFIRAITIRSMRTTSVPAPVPAPAVVPVPERLRCYMLSTLLDVAYGVLYDGHALRLDARAIERHPLLFQKILAAMRDLSTNEDGESFVVSSLDETVWDAQLILKLWSVVNAVHQTNSFETGRNRHLSKLAYQLLDEFWVMMHEEEANCEFDDAPDASSGERVVSTWRCTDWGLWSAPPTTYIKQRSLIRSLVAHIPREIADNHAGCGYPLPQYALPQFVQRR